MMIRLPKYWARALCLGIALLAAPAGEGRACSGDIVAGPDVTASYNPFEPVDLRLTKTVTVRNSSSQECVLWLELRPSELSGSPAFDYELKSEGGAMLAASHLDPGAGAVLSSGLLGPDETHDFHYVWTSPAGQMLAPARYDQLVEASLTATAGGAPPNGAVPHDTVNVLLVCNVEDHIGLNIAGAGLMKTIDFGELAEGESRSVVIQARSNRNFTLMVESANNGVLAMAEPYAQWQIPYSMSLGGAALTLPQEIGPFGETTIAGQSLEAVFTIGDASAKRAGLYTDEITIEIKPAM